MMDTLTSATYDDLDTDDGVVFSEESTDEQLFACAKQGHEKAWTILVNRLKPQLESLAARNRLAVGLDPSDVVQDVLLNMFRRADQFDESRGSVRSWIFQSLRLHLIDLHRKSERRVRSVSLQGIRKQGGTYDPSDEDPQLRQMEAAEEVNWLLPQLGEKYSTVLWQQEALGLNAREIAEGTDRKEATIRWRIAEAKKTAQLLLNKRYGGDISGNLR